MLRLETYAPGNRKQRFLLTMLIIVILFSLCSIWLLSNNFVSDIALFRWSKVLTVMNAENIQMEHFRLIYPHAPFYMLIPFTYLPAGIQAAAPYFVSCFIAAILFTCWNFHLRRNGLPIWQRGTLLTLMILQPTVLWAATSGGYTALSLLMFYFLYRACLRMIYHEDVRSFIMLGITMALYFFSDPITLFLFIALLPFLSIIAPKRILLSSPISVYMIIAMPLLIAIITWAYVNWIFEGDPMSYVKDPESSFLGGWQNTDSSSWLRTYGGQFIAPMFSAFIQLIQFFPIIFLLLPMSARYGNHIKASIILLFHPILAISFATSKYFLFHPLEVLTLISAGVMAELTVLPFGRRWKFPAVVILLILGGLSGWQQFSSYSSMEVSNWYKALTTHQTAEEYLPETSLGEWLRQNRYDTLIDDTTAYRAIVARGDADQLFLPFSDRFKLEVRYYHPTIKQLVVPDPSTRTGGRDRINLRYAGIYEHGLSGYRLVYDNLGWRVYRYDY